MNNNSNRLHSILAQEAALIVKMIAAEEETTPLLLAGPAGELPALNSRKEELIFQMQALEQQRQQILPRGTTLREFIAKEQPAAARGLEELRERLQELQVCLRRRQKTNRELLQNNLRFVASVLDILSPYSEGPLYAPGGEVQEKNRETFAAVLLDDQA